jgi:hypothetical protein
VEYQTSRRHGKRNWWVRLDFFAKWLRKAQKAHDGMAWHMKNVYSELGRELGLLAAPIGRCGMSEYGRGSVNHDTLE